MDRLIRQIQQWWQNADKTTRIVSIVGTALFLAVVALTLTLSSAPKMQPIASGSDESEKAGIYDELNKKGFHPEISSQGDVTVPAKDFHKAEMALATANKLPKSNKGGISLDGGAFDPPAVQDLKLLRSQETDLAESIETIDGVSAASVHIAPGKDSAVMDEKVAPTAVVNLTEASAGSVSKEAGKAIANLIQGSVTGLPASGVKVISNSGHILYDGAEQDGDSGMANNKLETEKAEGKTRTEQLQQELDSVFGRGNTIADVTVSYKMDPTTVVTHDVKPTDKPITQEKQFEKLNGAAPGGTAGIAGVESNTPGNPAPPVTTGGDESHKYDSQGTVTTFGVGTVDKKETMAPQLAGETISVIVDKNKVKDISGLTKFVQSKLGGNVGEDGFTATVVPTEFNTTDADLAKKATDDASGQQRMQMLMGLLPIAALLGVGFLLSKSLPKLVPATTRSLATNTGGALPDQFGGFMASGQRQTQNVHSVPDYSALAGYMPSHQDPQIIEHRYTFDPVTGAVIHGPADGEGGSEPAPETAEEREARQTEEVMKALGIDEAGEEDVDIESIKQKINIPLERIKRMADKKPEMTAMLIKTWMMEDHR